MNSPQPPSGPVGYAWLRDQLEVPSFLGPREARISGVSALEETPDGARLVPARMAPGTAFLDHILFALKNEDINLHLLTLALGRVSKLELEAAFAATRNGSYIRMAACLWEHVTGNQLDQRSAFISAPYHQFFDPGRYATGKSRRNPKWRIDFNGLGDLQFCPIVRLTPQLKSLLQDDILGGANDFAKRTDKETLDRALNWAYLSETEGSFAIEGEIPPQNKATAFANLLRQAGDPKKLSEALLCDLQNIAITNPLDKAVSFRTEQNRLQRGRGAFGVKYVPPAPERVDELMNGLLTLANEPPAEISPLIHAAVVSFGFVFIHPFMDGNGRLSRFLIHHCLGQTKTLPNAFVLPISVAMKRHEQDYLDALSTFSKPARDLCQVTWLGGDDYVYDWAPDAHLAFQYIDATACAEFILRMAKSALEEDLQHEAQWLHDFDAVFDAISNEHDIRTQDLSSLIFFAFDQGGLLSVNRRKQYMDRVPKATLDAIESAVRERVQLNSESGAQGKPMSLPR